MNIKTTLVVLVATVAVVFSQTTDDPDDIGIVDVFGEGDDETSVTPIFSTVEIVTQSTQACECVPPFRCSSTDISPGEGKCPVQQVCCVSPLPEVKLTQTKSECGLRHKTGLGLKVTGDENNHAEFGEFPWMIAIFKKELFDNGSLSDFQFKCGGTLIHEQVVLTAAHCVHRGKVNHLKVRAGEWDLENTEESFLHQERDVLRVIKHDNFYYGGLKNNMALLVVSSPFNLARHIDIVCLPPQNDNFPTGTGCLGLGWGKDSYETDGKLSVILKKIQLPIVPKQECEQKLRTTPEFGSNYFLHPSILCAGGEIGKDTCQGDGGGPLVCPVPANDKSYQQVGIVSGGLNCGTNIPAFYTHVSSFRNWIDKEMKDLNLTPQYGVATRIAGLSFHERNHEFQESESLK